MRRSLLLARYRRAPKPVAVPTNAHVWKDGAPPSCAGCGKPGEFSAVHGAYLVDVGGACPAAKAA